jgi:hypothetical protein
MSFQTAIVSVNSISQLIIVMVKCGILFEVWTEFLNVIKTSFAIACFSCSPPNFKFIKITPCCGRRRFNCFLNYRQKIRNSKFRSLSEATPYHHNVFTFTLFLPEGRAGVAWEPLTKLCSFSLSLFGFKGLI